MLVCVFGVYVSIDRKSRRLLANIEAVCVGGRTHIGPVCLIKAVSAETKVDRNWSLFFGTLEERLSVCFGTEMKFRTVATRRCYCSETDIYSFIDSTEKHRSVSAEKLCWLIHRRPLCVIHRWEILIFMHENLQTKRTNTIYPSRWTFVFHLICGARRSDKPCPGNWISDSLEFMKQPLDRTQTFTQCLFNPVFT